ncbi:hypothetical protein A2U01_0102869, partial [Trifolium medium]|nr:hypothetical protein [Trifolium medium]
EKKASGERSSKRKQVETDSEFKPDDEQDVLDIVTPSAKTSGK